MPSTPTNLEESFIENFKQNIGQSKPALILYIKKKWNNVINIIVYLQNRSLRKEKKQSTKDLYLTILACLSLTILAYQSST